MWHVYYRAGRFFVPVVAQADAGYFVDIEPVATIALDDPAGLASSIDAVIDKGNPRIPSFARSEFPRPVVLAPAGVKSWATFERKAACWTVTREAGDTVVTASGRGADGKWVDDPSSTVRVSTSDGAAGIVAVILQQLAERSDLT